jgi:hypothetical protein
VSAFEEYVAAMLDFARDARHESDSNDGFLLADILEVETFFLGDPLE